MPPAGPAARWRRAARTITGAAAAAACLLAATAAAPAATHRAGHASPASPARSRHAARPAAAPPLWTGIAAGTFHTCGIREGNTLWCWGYPAHGALGTGATTNQDQPQQISKPTAGWTSVTAGYQDSCATRNDGTLWCWGDNDFGQLGIGTTTSMRRPHQVTTPAATGWATVAAGNDHICATHSDGSLWCWGANGILRAARLKIVACPGVEVVTD